jgi:hypothetical protein
MVGWTDGECLEGKIGGWIDEWKDGSLDRSIDI